MEDADPAAAPLCHRSARFLKNHFRDAKSVSTAALNRWMRSGQNDPERFVDLLSRNGEALYASSKRALIMVVVGRLGTTFEDTFFVEMSSRAMLDGSPTTNRSLKLPSHGIKRH